MLNKVYLLLGSSLLGLYTAASLMGWEPTPSRRESPQQATARHASGGSRLFWISSYRGGK